jgi:hypothetical protein
MSAVCADRLDYCCSVLLEVELEVELLLEVLYCIGYIHDVGGTDIWGSD